MGVERVWWTGADEDTAARRTGYLAALADYDLAPGEWAWCECPRCVRPFLFHIPSADADAVVVGGELQVVCPFACGRTGALSAFLVAPSRGVAAFAVARRCPYCPVTTVADEGIVSCPVCAGH